MLSGWMVKTNGASSGEVLEARRGTVENDIPKAEQDNWRNAQEIKPAISNPEAQRATERYFAIMPDTTVQMRWRVEDRDPAIVKSELRGIAESERDAVLTRGTEVYGVSLKGDDRTLLRVIGALQALERDLVPSVKWKQTHGAQIEIDKTAMVAVFSALVAFVQGCYDCEDAVVQKINSGEYTTTAQIRAHDWPA